MSKIKSVLDQVGAAVKSSTGTNAKPPRAERTVYWPDARDDARAGRWLRSRRGWFDRWRRRGGR